MKKSIYLFPQRYEPYGSLERNQYIGKHWTKEQVLGISRMQTFIHGFFSVTQSRNLFNWIGCNKQEFMDRVTEFGSNGKHGITVTDELIRLY